MTTRRSLIIAGGSLIVLLAGLGLRSPAAPDSSRVDPSLLRLVPPFASFTTLCYQDGGSIGIRVVDSRGHREAFALPLDDASARSYSRLFAGVTDTSQPGGVEIPFTTETRRMLIFWVETHRSRADSSDLALSYLRGRPEDYAHLFAHGVWMEWRRLFH